MDRKQYFLGWEVELIGDERTERFLRAQIVSENTAKGLGRFLELTFDENGKLIAAVYVNEDGPDAESYKSALDSGKQLFAEYPLNKVFEFVPDPEGINRIGGETPQNFVIPKTSSGFPVQYIGMLNHHDPAFGEILEFDLHLVCPIYLGFPELWVDYSDSTHPVIFGDEEVLASSSSFDFDENTEIVFEEITFSTQPWPSERFGGHTGAATWIQGPDIPVCPKSGEPMQLICQLGDGDLMWKDDKPPKSVIPNTKRHNVELSEENSYLARYIEKMDFWGSGDLYVFYCPGSKVVRYLIQNT